MPSVGEPFDRKKKSGDREMDPKTEQKLKIADSLPDSRKVEELTAALLREYMHRKGYKKTLEKFDQENPRTETTIASRNVMSELMALQAIANRNQAQKEHPPFATIMEQLCSYRLRKREIRGVQRAAGAKPPPTEIPVDDADGNYDSSDAEEALEAQVAQREEQIKKLQAEAEERQKKEEKRLKKEKKEKKKKKKEAKEASRLSKEPSLDAAMNLVKSLPGAKEPAAAGAADKPPPVARGSKWMPGGSASAISIPTVGLSTSGGQSQLTTSTAPPSFLAGDGMSLMANRKAADPAAEWEAPIHVSKAKPSSSSTSALKPSVLSGSYYPGSRAENLGFSPDSSPNGSASNSPSRDHVGGVIVDPTIAANVSPDHFKKLYNPQTQPAPKSLKKTDSFTGGTGGLMKGSPTGTGPMESSFKDAAGKGRSERKVKILIDDP